MFTDIARKHCDHPYQNDQSSGIEASRQPAAVCEGGALRPLPLRPGTAEEGRGGQEGQT